MKFRTKSGSVYELDEENKKARRVHGQSDSVRLTEEWRDYSAALVLKGRSAIIDWTPDSCIVDGEAASSTITTEVVEIYAQENAS